ncbi:MAG: alpha/beta hydrolase [Spirochaetaceae bacterium]|jgi:alpha-beta hydrolase superfamily lysophospholipase|nr:alpha/beta hydrolase [Spirochaetaceae bacterium]
MVEEKLWFETHNEIKLFVRKWKPDTPPRAAVNIIHGMGEHGGRYAGIAAFLCGAGIEVWCADQRGHGKTADVAVNSEANGGLPGHCADKGAITKVLLDINKINEKMKSAYPALPLFLLGHSWGSFMAQNYIESSRTNLAGCILSGTRGPDRTWLSGALALIRVVTALYGVRHRSFFVNKLVFGSYNKSFAPAKTHFDWLSRDAREAAFFAEDPLCGALPSAGFFRDMLILLKQVHRSRNLDKIRRTLPVYMFSGSKDPVGGMGENVTALAEKYKKIRISDLELVLYPDARHECLHEINREEVMHNLLTWLEKHI